MRDGRKAFPSEADFATTKGGGNVLRIMSFAEPAPSRALVLPVPPAKSF